MKVVILLFTACAWVVAVLGLVWGSAALWIDGPTARWLAAVYAAGLAGTGIFALALIRPRARALLVILVLVLGVIAWWTLIPASNSRDWLPDVARLPAASIAGDRLTVSNVRNFEYRSETDFTERWETRTYDLSQLRGVDMFFCFWGPTMIAHTIASWDFADGQDLAISIETRKEKGETYSAVLGFFKQYELYYVVADERDVIGVRTNHRGEQAFLYRIQMPPELARAILLDYFAEINQMVEEPRWYNAATHNCTTTIRDHVKHVAPARPWSWQLLLNGYLEELWYERGALDRSLPFAELRARSEITQRAKAAGARPDFSEQIRAGLPGAAR